MDDDAALAALRLWLIVIPPAHLALGLRIGEDARALGQRHELRAVLTDPRHTAAPALRAGRVIARLVARANAEFVGDPTDALGYAADDRADPGDDGLDDRPDLFDDFLDRGKHLFNCSLKTNY